MLSCITDIVTAYVITFLITSSSIMLPFRNWLYKKTPKWQIGDNPHFIYCRMCIGFWVSLIVSWLANENLFLIYGLSYFLATQERK